MATEPVAAPDPSMEDILASIRRILDEEPAVPVIEGGEGDGAGETGALLLDDSMLADIPPPLRPAPQALVPGAPLMNPETADLAAASMSSLLQAVASDRGLGISRGGPTIEDMVREELRPMLKTWLDTHLPPLIERLVRLELERVVSRAQV